MLGFVEGCGLNGEEDAAVTAADEVEAEFVLDELELERHSVASVCGCVRVTLQKADCSLRSE